MVVGRFYIGVERDRADNLIGGPVAELELRARLAKSFDFTVYEGQGSWHSVELGKVQSERCLIFEAIMQSESRKAFNDIARRAAEDLNQASVLVTFHPIESNLIIIPPTEEAD